MENEKTLNQTREYTPEQTALLQRLEKLIAEKNSAAEVCRLIGIKQPVLSALRKGNYGGDLDRQFGIIEDYFKVKEEAVKNYKPVRYAPISTSNLTYQTIRNIQIMGGFGIVVGDPGVGKTKAVLKYTEDNPESCITVKAGACTRGTRAVLKQIALKLNIPTNQSIDDMYMSIEAKLHDGMLIVVDEAQHLSFNAIEALRQISDDFDERDQTCGVVLVGNHGIIERMDGGKTGKDYKQTVNRRWQLQELKTTDISLNDIRMIFPVLEGQVKELEFLKAVSNSKLGLRGAVRLFTKAYSINKYDFKRLVETAKITGANIEGAEKAVRS